MGGAGAVMKTEWAGLQLTYLPAYFPNSFLLPSIPILQMTQSQQKNQSEKNNFVCAQANVRIKPV